MRGLDLSLDAVGRRHYQCVHARERLFALPRESRTLLGAFPPDGQLCRRPSNAAELIKRRNGLEPLPAAMDASGLAVRN